MRDVSIARNYAEALLALATKAKGTAEWGGLISAMGDAVAKDAKLRQFLEAPQIAAADKNAVLGKALEGKAPKPFIRFIQKLVANRRQMLLSEVAVEYHNLLDAAEGRVHARVTVARAFSDSFAGIRPADVPGFVAAQIVGGAIAAVVFGWLLGPAHERKTA